MLQHTLGSLPDVLSEEVHGAFGDMGELWYFIQGGQKRLRRHFNLLYDCFGWHVDILGKTFPPASGNEEGVALATYSHSHASGQSSSVIGGADQIVERSQTPPVPLPNHGDVFGVSIIVADTQVECSPFYQQTQIDCRLQGIAAYEYRAVVEGWPPVAFVFDIGAQCHHPAEVLLRQSPGVKVCPFPVVPIHYQNRVFRQGEDVAAHCR